MPKGGVGHEEFSACGTLHLASANAELNFTCRTNSSCGPPRMLYFNRTTSVLFSSFTFGLSTCYNQC